MKRYMRLAVGALMTCTALVLIIYSSMLVNKVNTSVDFTISTTDLNPTLKPRALLQPSTTVKKPNLASKHRARPSRPRPVILPIKVSPEFRKTIPQNSGFWNRKFHYSLSQLDAGNLLHFNGSSESTESLRANIPDLNSYSALYHQFLHSMHYRTPDLLINQPNKCRSNGQPERVTLLLAIKSVPRNFEERQAIRETWGQEGQTENGLLVRRVFLLGVPSLDAPDVRALLAFEEQFGDLLVWDYMDSFYNLTLKDHMFLEWTLQYCAQASFIFKGDDDVFVNPEAILKYVMSLDADKASKLYAGHIIYQASPHRSTSVKYYIPQSFYDGPYPPYAGGGGFLFSGALLPSLYSVTWIIPFYPIDDVYTGMCFHALGISPEKHPGFQTFDIREQDRENPCVYRDLLLVHRRSPEQALRLWRSIKNPLLTC